MRLSLSYEPDTLDPHKRKLLSDFAMISNFYEPLVLTDADGRVRPALALRWESPDPLTWIFHLRRGVRFHSGKELTADDVVYTFERLRTGEGLQLSAYVRDIDRVRAVDPLTVEIHTRGPTSLLVTHLRFLMVVPQGSGKGLEGFEDGTGPYRLERWEPPGFLQAVRFDAYWGERPAFGRFEALLGRTPEQSIADVTSGRSRFIQCASRRALETASAQPALRVVRKRSIFVVQLGYDLANEATPFCPVRPNPFKNRLVRRALSLAIDRSELAARLPSFAAPAFEPVPSFVFGYNTRVPEPAADLAGARASLGLAGLPNGFEVTLHSRKLLLDAAAILKEQLSRVGVRLKVEGLPDPEFYDLVIHHRASFFLARWGTLTGDAGEMLDTSVHTPDPARHLGAQNFGGYSNPALDRQIEQSWGLVEVDRRRVLLENIVGRLVDDLVWIPLYVDEEAYAFSKELSWRPRNDTLVLPAEMALGGS